MVRSLRPAAWLLLFALVGGLVLVPAADAHPAGVPPGYNRMVHDCNDDYGGHGLLEEDPPGHDVHSIDVREATIDGTAMFLVRVTVGQQGSGDTAQASERITFETPRHKGADAISTLVETPRRASETTITFIEGTEPARLETGLAAYYTEADGGEEDSGRFSFELGYTYDQLEVQNDEKLTNFKLQGYHGANRQAADHMPGSYAGAADPDACDDQDQANAAFENTAGFTVKASDWVHGDPPPDNEGEGDNGNNGSTNQAPSVDFTFSPAAPSTADTVTFTDASTDADGSVIGWDWDFGDGTSATGSTATHRFSDDGSYTVTLWATDDEGATRSLQKTVQVSNQAPTAKVGLPTSAGPGSSVTFQDESTDADGSVTTWLWDFGDGTTANTQNPAHTYADAGTYTVGLTVTDDDGASDRTTIELEVGNAGIEEAPGPAALPLLLMGCLALVALRRLR